MNKKQKLLFLLQKAKTNGVNVDKYLSNIDDYLPETIDTIIAVLEKTEERRKRINNGDAKTVIDEIQLEQSEKKQEATKTYVQKIHAKEEKKHEDDQILAEELLNKLENIHIP